MPRSVACVGIPVHLEEKTFTLKNGEHAGEEMTSLNFHLLHPLTAATGSTLFETRSAQVIRAIRLAHEEVVEVVVVATPDAVRSDKTDDKGRPRDWVKLRALAVG